MWLGVALLGGVAAAGVWMALLMKRRATAQTGTWDCGYVRPTSRMQYTGSSLGQMAVDLLGWALWPRGLKVRLRKAFPKGAVFSRSVPDVVLDRMLVPLFEAGRRGAGMIHGIQQGSVQAYMVYLLVILIVLVLL
jgi:hydrogenase-4 component B